MPTKIYPLMVALVLSSHLSCHRDQPSASAFMARGSFVINPVTVSTGEKTVVSIALKKANGEAYSSLPVTFVSDSLSYQVNPNPVTTDANGFAQADYVSTDAGPQTLTALFAGLAMSAQVSYVAGNPNSSMSTFSTYGANSINKDVPLSIFIRDTWGNPVAGAKVKLSSTEPRARRYEQKLWIDFGKEAA